MNPELVSWYVKFPEGIILKMIYLWVTPETIDKDLCRGTIMKIDYTMNSSMVYPKDNTRI